MQVRAKDDLRRGDDTYGGHDMVESGVRIALFCLATTLASCGTQLVDLRESEETSKNSAQTGLSLQEERYTNRVFKDNNRALRNQPLKGFSYYTTPTAAVTYDHVPKHWQWIKLVVFWSDLQPQKNKYDWEDLDKAIGQFKERGKNVSLRLELTNGTKNHKANGSRNASTPNWLWKVGVPSITVNNNKKGIGPTRHPHYWNKTYQNHARQLITKVIERYTDKDGRSQIDHLSVRSYGHAGEWAAQNNPFPWQKFSNKKRDVILNQLLGIYTDNPAWKNSNIPLSLPLASVHGLNYKKYLQSHIHQRALNKGLGIRFDAIRAKNPIVAPIRRAIQSYHGKSFVTGETGNGWNPNTDPPMEIVERFLEARATVASYGGHRAQGDIFTSDPVYRKAWLHGTRYLGYRFVPEFVGYPRKIKHGHKFNMRVRWANHGVGKLIKNDFKLRAYLVNRDGEIVWKRWDSTNFDFTTVVTNKAYNRKKKSTFWQGTKTYTANHVMARMHKSVPPGDYTLFLGLKDPRDESRAIAFPIDTKVKFNRMHRIGKVTVEP